jgi:stringent starvation protein B
VTDQKPYLIRAIYEWIVDNKGRPHVMVDTTNPNVQIPAHLYEKASGKPFQAFNIAMHATTDLSMDNAYITCSARFSGKAFQLVLPIEAISAIYSPDDPVAGQGMSFQHVLYRDRPVIKPSEVDVGFIAQDATAPQPESPEKPTGKARASFLTVVK